MAEGGATTGFSDLYGQLLQEFGEVLREAPSRTIEAQQNVREELVRCLWFGSHFDPDLLATDDGRRLEVVSPGWWNVEGGPDFARAELLIEGAGRVVGDVEVHTHASDWRAHGHQGQPTYDGVVLHVVMWNDAEGREILLHSGQSVPQLTLAPFVEEEIGELMDIVDLESPPAGEEHAAVTGRYCGGVMARGEMSPEWLGRFLDCAGDHRVRSKAERVGHLQQKRSLEQVLYECVAEALGYKSNRMPFLQLANILPLSLLREMVPADAAAPEKRTALETAFFGAGGFLDEPEREDADEETRAYVKDLSDRWTGLPPALEAARMSREHWTFGGTRPVNYPVRRIAALSVLYAEHLARGLFSHLLASLAAARAEGRRRLDRACRDALLGVFAGLEHPYWGRRYTFGGKVLARPTTLVGAERAQAIVVDMVLPLLLAHVRQEGDEELLGRLHMVWRCLPRRAPDAVVRRMCQVMFQDRAQVNAVVDSERRQQGLHQLHRDFCSVEDGCAQCLLHRVHKAGRKLEMV
jgi:hypothetical protein